ncbi:hypothetical protein FNF31_03936 [Cafeteria roenbergensis]|uniref:Uncharacterized protein n=1 Tax=Cafeteria roenbergensis TaxID=33653 RepID=A0A5A8D786_CAFRO|nr:hypothetical protein FNF31_03936 [Cafeteria roenbergensis]
MSARAGRIEVDARLSAAAAAGRAPEATKALPVRSWPGCAQSESPAPPLRVPASAAYDIREVDLLSPSPQPWHCEPTTFPGPSSGLALSPSSF